MFLELICLSFLIIYYLREVYERRVNKCPPGPWPIPIFGSLLQMGAAASEPHLSFVEFSKRYGEIYRLKVGPTKEFVITSTVETMRDLFAHDATLGRDMHNGLMYDRQMGRNLGFALAEGRHWEVTRSWSVRQLRDSGFGKSAAMDKLVKGQLTAFLEKVESEANDAGVSKIQLHGVFEKFVLRVFWRMLVGDMIGVQDEEEMMDNLVKLSRVMAKKIMGAGLLTAFPFLKYLMPKFTGYDVSMEFNNYSRNISQEFLRDRIKDIKESTTYRESGGLLDAFAEKMIKGDQPEFFFEDNWSILFNDWLQASTDTTSSFLETTLLFLILHPDVQEKVYREMRQVVPEKDEIFYSHFKKMPYLQAVYLEVHRRGKILQHLVPRKVMEDFKYKGYNIKKGTIILPDTYSAYADQKLFDEPESFNPERFLDKNGNLIDENHILPFGIGKRMCPGNTFADNTSFIMLTGILDKYQLSLVPGAERPTEKMHVGFTSRPYPFEIVFKRRREF